MPSEARACAHRVVWRVFEQGAYADRAFHAEARSLDGRDRPLAMRLAYGAVQRKGTLDWMVERLAERRLQRLDGAVLAALRVGLYELGYLGQAPDYAVVADTVELVKRAGSHGHGLANAVMRRAARERGSLLEGLEDSSAASAAIAHSYPLWVAEMWWEHLGAAEARAAMAGGNEPAERAVRVNTLVADPAEVAGALPGRRDARFREAEPLQGHPLPEGLVLNGGVDVVASKQWREGAVIAQSRAAMLVSRILDPQPGERVLDLCAAPGGKTTHIAALMGGRGRIVAVERHPGRARVLRETVARMRAGVVEVEQADATAMRGRAGSFDRVLVDAPCSGLGTVQAHPDLRWRVQPPKVEELAKLQSRMLSTAAGCVRAGGTLVYSTCTISPTENEHQIETFLSSRPDFALMGVGAGATEERGAGTGAGAGAPAGDRERFIQTMPHRDGTAGFFIAKLRRS